ncbi:MAG: hypothetical protein U1D30_14630 [Planctomycetota bacterium]
MATGFSQILRCLAFATLALPIIAIWSRGAEDPKGFAIQLGLTYAVLLINVLLLARGPNRKWLFRLLSLQFALLAAWLLLESGAALGIVDYRLVFGTLGDEPWRNPLNRLDPELLHVHKPHQHLVGIQQGGDIAYHFHVPERASYPYDVRYDCNGFRNETDLKKADIILVGDSLIEATSVSQSETLAALLEKDQNAVVANLGQLWYSPIQELIVLKRYGLPLKPRLCIWAFFSGNDLSDIRRYQTAMQDWPGTSASFHSLPARSFSKNALLAAFHRWGKPARLPDGLQRAADFHAPDGKSTRIYLYYPDPPMDDENLRSLAVAEKVFLDAWNLLKTEGISLLVVYIPTKFRVYHELCTFPVGSECFSWRESDLPVRLRKMLTSISPEICFLDLTDPMRESARRGALLYWPDDTHWTPAGNRAAATAIHSFLQTNPSLTH